MPGPLRRALQAFAQALLDGAQVVEELATDRRQGPPAAGRSNSGEPMRRYCFLIA